MIATTDLREDIAASVLINQHLSARHLRGLLQAFLGCWVCSGVCISIYIYIYTYLFGFPDANAISHPKEHDLQLATSDSNI